MKMKKLRRPLTFLCAACFLLGIAGCTPTQEAPLYLIPYPNHITLQNGSYLMSPEEVPSITLLEKDTLFLTPEDYRLTIGKEGVAIEAPSEQGAFYAKQTLAQLCASAPVRKDGRLSLPYLTISDSPRFPWRGMHLDVSRHFFSVAFIKKQLDALASYKINTFHWHLTDGAGWRLEIPGYPKLTQEAAWRPQARWKDWWTQGRTYCTQDTPGAYGGYYTAEDVRDVLAYAAERHITVIPEIEMPGHSEEVLAVYPELACSGKPFVSSEFCIGNPATFRFLEDVLTYVMELFPSTYIHIGGDEANHEHWKHCPKCQALMKREGYTDVAQLQSHLIQHMDAFLTAHGRKLLGWDEILNGGLAPNATVLSWRGIQGGIAAAELGHDAVMSPGGYCYLDGYQADPETQPEAIGGFLPLEKAYSFDPAPDTLSHAVRQHILGLQGNVWAEYIPTPEHAEYMIYPRILALAEVGWSQPATKDWNSFNARVNEAVALLRAKGYNPYPLFDRPLTAQTVHAQEGYIEVTLYSERTAVDIRYTTDGSAPGATSARYQKPLRVIDSLLLQAQLFQKDQPVGPTIQLRTDYHKGIGKKAHYDTRIYPDYAAGGDTALTDGYRGGKGYGDGRWQGFCPNELDVTIDLGTIQPVKDVHAQFMQMVGPWIFFPSKVEVYASENGTDFKFLGEENCTVPIDREGALFRDFGWKGAPVNARYIRYVARQSEKRAFIFTDEIRIL